MKFHIPVCAVAAFGLVSIGLSQSEASGSARVSPEIALIQEATALVDQDRFEEAWQLLILPASRDGIAAIAPPSRLGWRVACVAGALRNRSDYEIADVFARFALMQPWTEARRTLSRSDVAEAGYWCAWIASEILGDRTSAQAWIEEAAKADPESKRISGLKEKLAEAERSFPTR